MVTIHIGDDSDKPSEHFKMVLECLKNDEDLLTIWEIEFLDNVKRQGQEKRVQ